MVTAHKMAAASRMRNDLVSLFNGASPPYVSLFFIYMYYKEFHVMGRIENVQTELCCRIFFLFVMIFYR